MEGIDAWVEPSTGSTVAFALVIVLVVGPFVVGVARAYGSRRAGTYALLGALVWMALTGAWVAAGLPARGAPGLMGFFAIANVGAIALAFSPVGTRLIEGVPLWTLAAFQGFRLPLELVLHAWSSEGVVPVQMTFEGHNFDIVTGTLGLLVAVVALVRRRDLPRPWLLTFNAIGSALLLAVIVIVLLSSPLPIKRYEGPPILLGLHLPYAWIAPVCVAGALSAHLMLWRALLRPAAQRSTSVTASPSAR
ncbi:MAG: hypothetical protein KC619_15585 [Myxococcales bacterium]|nr:hypothetical protein [Myxococcales bacterium]